MEHAETSKVKTYFISSTKNIQTNKYVGHLQASYSSLSLQEVIAHFGIQIGPVQQVIWSFDRA